MAYALVFSDASCVAAASDYSMQANASVKQNFSDIHPLLILLVLTQEVPAAHTEAAVNASEKTTPANGSQAAPPSAVAASPLASAPASPSSSRVLQNPAEEHWKSSTSLTPYMYIYIYGSFHFIFHSILHCRGKYPYTPL